MKKILDRILGRNKKNKTQSIQSLCRDANGEAAVYCKSEFKF